MTGKVLKAMRKKARMSQTEFGEEIGFSADDVCSFETTRRDLSQVNLYANRQIENFFKGESNG